MRYLSAGAKQWRKLFKTMRAVTKRDTIMEPIGPIQVMQIKPNRKEAKRETLVKCREYWSKIRSMCNKIKRQHTQS